MTLVWSFVLSVAFGLGALEWLISPKDVPLTVVTDIAAGWAFCVAGVLAWGGHRPRAIALLLEVTGLTWLLGSLVPAMIDVYRGPLVHLLLAYPSGRLPGRLSQGVVIAAYLSGAFGQMPAVQSTAPILVSVVALVAIRTAAGSTGARARGRKVAAAAAVAVASMAGVLTVGTLAGWLDPDTGRLAFALVLGATSIFLAADLRWGGWARDAFTRMVIDLGDSDQPATLRGFIAEALGDRTVVIGYATGVVGEYVDDSGRPLEVPKSVPGRSLTMLKVDGEQVGILISEGEAETDEALVKGVSAAARLALSNARLQMQARRRITELASSRRRLIDAADAERSRIHHELEIRVGRHLTSAEALLVGFAASGGPSAVTDELVDGLHGVTAELTEFTVGIGSGWVVADGLAAAVTRLAQHSSIPIDIDIPADRLPTLVETTAYFVCSEGLANAAKHARATRISVRAKQESGHLDLEVVDNGNGGADVAGGSGIRGLADRVEAIGGSLLVEDRPTGGTRLHAALPLEDALEPAPSAT